MENWIFFGANILVTGFNAWLSWRTWQRTKAADLPSVSIRAYRSSEVDAVEIEALIHNSTRFAWRAESAELVQPRGPNLFYPLSLMQADAASGEPWNTKSVDLDAATGARSVRMAVTAEPDGRTYREVLWVRASAGIRIKLRLVFRSSEPQPRVHIVKVNRTAPMLKAVIAI